MKRPLEKYPRLGQYPHEATKKELVGYVEDLTDYLQDCLEELRQSLKRADCSEDPNDRRVAYRNIIEEILGQ